MQQQELMLKKLSKVTLYSGGSLATFLQRLKICKQLRDFNKKKRAKKKNSSDHKKVGISL